MFRPVIGIFLLLTSLAVGAYENVLKEGETTFISESAADSTSSSSIAQNHAPDSLQQDQYHNDKKHFLHEKLKASRGLVATGMALHFTGLGLSTLGPYAFPEANYGTVMTISTISSIAFILGPILACSGASSADGTLQQHGYDFPQSRVWREYGNGWAYQGAGVALAVMGLIVASSSNDGYFASIFLIGAAGLSIAGEVQWIRAMVHSGVYVNKANAFLDRVSFVPTTDFKGKHGLVMNWEL